MFKILILTLFAICHCQSVVEVKDEGQRVLHFDDLKAPNVASVSVARPSPAQVVHGFPEVSSVVSSQPVVSNVVSGVPQQLSIGNTQYLAIPVSSLSSLNVGRVGSVGSVGSVGTFGAVGGNVVSAGQYGGPILAAIQNVGRTVEFRNVPFSDAPLVPTEIVVEPSEIPLNIHFKSKSSTVHISQSHQPGEPGSVETTQSQDEPSRVIHEVVKPIVQEVREVVQPYRQVVQEVHPVVEQVHTVVSRGEGVRQQYVAPIQPQVSYQPQPVNVVRVAQPVSYQVGQPVSYQVGQPVSYQVGQPVSYQVGQPQVFRSVVAQPFGVGVGIESHPALSAFNRIVAQQPNAFLSVGQPVGVGVPVQTQRPVQAVAYRQPVDYAVRIQPVGVPVRTVTDDNSASNVAEHSAPRKTVNYNYNDES